MSEAPTEHVKVGTLIPNLAKLNLMVKVLTIREPRVIFSRRDRSEHRVTEAFVGDETGCVLLTVWDNQIDALNVGGVYEIRNGYTNLFRGSLRLNMGKYGTAEEVETEIDVDTKKNLSEERHRDTSWRRASTRPFRRRRRR